MNKTSPLVLALLFTGASALRSRQDTTVASSATVPSTAVAGDASTTHPTNQYEEGDRIDEEENRRVVDSILEESNAILASQGQEVNLVEKDFKIMADDTFNLFVNGASVANGDDWERTYRASGIMNNGVDTVAIEMFDKRWGGNGIMCVDDVCTNPDDWLCKDVPKDGQLPEFWSMNKFDDSTWAAAVSIGQNNREMSPFRGWTSKDFPENAHYIWSGDEHSDHVICRYNQLPLEERLKEAGMCKKELEAFEAIVNRLLQHHQNTQEHWRQQRSEFRNAIAQLSSQNEAQNQLIHSLYEQMETNAKNHQQVVADYEAHIEKLHDDYAKQMKDLQEHMNEQCSADLGDLQKQLEDQFNGILEEAHQAHKTAKEEMAEAHGQAMEDQRQRAEDHLANTVSEMNENHEQAMSDKVDELNQQHKDTMEDKVSELMEHYANEMTNLENELQKNHEENLAEKLEDLTKNLTHEFERAMKEQKEVAEKLLSDTIETSKRQLKEQSEVMGAEIDRLTRKHDYLYESCTTVQVVDGELVIN